MNLFSASLSKRNNRPFLFIINGESNSGGYALNSEAPIGEIGIRSSVEILNNTTLVFEDLNIGVNNLLGHAGLSNGTTHGFELELANRAETSNQYLGTKLIKTGQGGSTIAQWGIGGSYFNTFIQRLNTAKTLINFEDYNIVVLYSLGINDAISGTPTSTWKIDVTNYFIQMRAEIGYGDIPIIMTEFQGMGGGGYGSYNTAIKELASTINNVYSVDVTGSGLRDANHWNYVGMKQVTGAMLDVFENLI